MFQNSTKKKPHGPELFSNTISPKCNCINKESDTMAKQEIKKLVRLGDILTPEQKKESDEAYKKIEENFKTFSAY